MVMTELSVPSARILENLRDQDEYDYEIFPILIVTHAWASVILAGKRDSRRHSTTTFSENVVVAWKSYQM